MEKNFSDSSWLIFLLVGLGLIGGAGLVARNLNSGSDIRDETKFSTIIINDTGRYRDLRLEIEGENYSPLGEIEIPKGTHLARFLAEGCEALEVEYTGEEDGEAAIELSRINLSCEENSETTVISESDFLLVEYTSNSDERDGKVEEFIDNELEEIDDDILSFD